MLREHGEEDEVKELPGDSLAGHGEKQSCRRRAREEKLGFGRVEEQRKRESKRVGISEGEGERGTAQGVLIRVGRRRGCHGDEGIRPRLCLLAEVEEREKRKKINPP